MRQQSKTYLAYVRTLPCCHCKTSPCEPHHLIGIGMGMASGKASDIASVPLCRPCHVEVHKCPADWPQAKWLIETLESAIKEGVITITDGDRRKTAENRRIQDRHYRHIKRMEREALAEQKRQKEKT